MANDSNSKSYEEARNQRLLENKKRIEDLGLLKLAKDLSPQKKYEKSQPRLARPKQVTDKYVAEPRRSSRQRNPIVSYRDDVDIGLPTIRKRSKWNSSWASYLARPLEEVKTASYEERARALRSAEKLQSNLQSGCPSFVKSMVRSHVYSCFWLGLPTRFCVAHLPKSTTDLVLQNEEGSEYDAVYISKRTGLSGGWRGFALDHKLDDGDALVFELVEPTRFKVYIVRAFDCEDQDDDEPVPEDNDGLDAKETSKEVTKKRKKDNQQTAGYDAEGTTKEKRKKKDEHELQNPTETEKEKPLRVSAPRRSVRNK